MSAEQYLEVLRDFYALRVEAYEKEQPLIEKELATICKKLRAASESNTGINLDDKENVIET
jgi:ferritin